METADVLHLCTIGINIKSLRGGNYLSTLRKYNVFITSFRPCENASALGRCLINEFTLRRQQCKINYKLQMP